MMARIMSITNSKTAMIELTADEILYLQTILEPNRASTELSLHLFRVFDVLNETVSYDLFKMTKISIAERTKTEPITDGVQDGF